MYRYDQPYDRSFRNRWGTPPDRGSWFAGDRNRGSPIYGRGWRVDPWQWPAYGWGAGYGEEFGVRRRPESPQRSGTYGREGDRAVRRWIDRYGYDTELMIRPAHERSWSRRAR